MSRSAGSELPAALRERLDGERLEEKVGLTVLLLTIDVDGWPRVAMLSAGEVLAAGPRTVRLALWPGSSSTANLARDGRCTLAMVHAGSGWYVRCAGIRGPDLKPRRGRALAFFELTVGEVLEDAVAYARLLDGIRFELPDRQPVLEAWRQAVAAMRAAASLRTGSRTSARESPASPPARARSPEETRQATPRAGRRR